MWIDDPESQDGQSRETLTVAPNPPPLSIFLSILSSRDRSVIQTWTYDHDICSDSCKSPPKVSETARYNASFRQNVPLSEQATHNPTSHLSLDTTKPASGPEYQISSGASEDASARGPFRQTAVRRYSQAYQGPAGAQERGLDRARQG